MWQKTQTTSAKQKISTRNAKPNKHTYLPIADQRRGQST